MKEINSKDIFNKYNKQENKKSANRTLQTIIIIPVAIILFVWMFSPSSEIEKDTRNTTSTYNTSASYKTSTSNYSNADCHWCKVLKYAILKNDNNKAVLCREKFTNGGNYILCTYETAGYSKKALFKTGDNKAYAVNGTARAREFTKYSDIEPYDISKHGSVDIHSILSVFN